MLLFLASCRPPEGEMTGDEGRSGAKTIVSGGTYDDKVASKGDPVDYKRFEVEKACPLTLNIYWDNPEIKATVAILDYFGGEVRRINHEEPRQKDTIELPVIKDGIYFVEIRALKKSSVYTVELILGGEDTGAGGVPRPE
jgi:hypothetical protein